MESRRWRRGRATACSHIRQLNRTEQSRVYLTYTQSHNFHPETMSSAVKQQKLNFIEQNMSDTSFYDSMMAWWQYQILNFASLLIFSSQHWISDIVSRLTSHLQLSSHSRIQNLGADYCISCLVVISHFPSLQSHSQPNHMCILLSFQFIHDPFRSVEAVGPSLPLLRTGIV